MIKRAKAEAATGPFSREKVERQCCFDPRKTQMFSQRSLGYGLGALPCSQATTGGQESTPVWGSSKGSLPLASRLHWGGAP